MVNSCSIYYNNRYYYNSIYYKATLQKKHLSHALSIKRQLQFQKQKLKFYLEKLKDHFVFWDYERYARFLSFVLMKHLQIMRFYPMFCKENNIHNLAILLQYTEITNQLNCAIYGGSRVLYAKQ